MPEPAMGVLVADDERPARRRLLDLLRQEPGIASIWEATDGQMAVNLINSCHPDLVFLDVKMPELDGLGVIDAVGIAAMPAIVNLARVAHLEPISHGEFEVVLKSGKRVRLSRTYRGPVEERLGQSL